MESHMRDYINVIFDVLDLLVVRLTLLALQIFGAYTLIKGQSVAPGNFIMGMCSSAVRGVGVTKAATGC